MLGSMYFGTSKIGLEYLEANVTIGTWAYNIDIRSILIMKYFGNMSVLGSYAIERGATHKYLQMAFKSNFSSIHTTHVKNQSNLGV